MLGTNSTMAADGAASLTKHALGNYDVITFNSTYNVTYVVDGPIVDSIQEKQFYILLPSFVYTAILMLFGMPGNFIVILVYLLKMAKTTSRHFIISLAVCDFINCGFGMPVELTLLFNFYDFDFPILCKISRFSTFFMNNASSCVLIGIAIDRFRRVCLPLRPNMTVSHSKVICITVGVVSMISATPALYIYGTKTISSPLTGLNNTFIRLKTCYVDDDVRNMIPLVFNLYLFIVILLMFFSLMIMYALIARVVCSRKQYTSNTIKRHTFSVSVDPKTNTTQKTRLSTRILRSFSEHSPKLLRPGRRSPRSNSPLPDICEPLAVPDARDRAYSDTSVRRHGGKEIRAGRTTMILFIVTLVFVLSFVPYLAIVNIRYINPTVFTNLPPLEKAIYHFTLRSYLLNSAVNPIIYCFLNRQFRMKVKCFFKSLFCRPCKK